MSRHSPLPLPLEQIPFVLRLEDRTPPLDWGQVFGRSGPVEVEIGSGKGLFLMEASQRRPEANFVGVERAVKWYRRAVYRFLRHERPNVRLLCHDAFDFLARWTPPGSLAALHIYFPDPWPKKRHSKRRLLQDSLYGLAAQALAPGAPLLLASDVGPYLEEAAAALEGSASFQRVLWPEDAPDRLPTNYAVKYLQAGRSLGYVKFVRRAGPKAAGTPPARDGIGAGLEAAPPQPGPAAAGSAAAGSATAGSATAGGGGLR